MYTALAAAEEALGGEAEITVVDPQSNMTYQPFLPEAAAGQLEPRHVVVPLRKVLRKLPGDHRTRHPHRARAQGGHRAAGRGRAYEIDYDLLVVCPGSISRLLPIPGLAEHGIGFKTIGEAIYLRNHVLSRLDLAASMTDPERRPRALTLRVRRRRLRGRRGDGRAGGHGPLRAAVHPTASSRPTCAGCSSRRPPGSCPRCRSALGSYTVDRLAERNIDVRLDTRLESVVGGHVVLSDGEEFDAETLVWTAGVKANPMLAATDLPLDDQGRLPCRADLTVRGVDGVFAAGDCAAVPDLSKDDPDALCSPSAQHAVRQAKMLADNVVATLRGAHPPRLRARLRRLGRLARPVPRRRGDLRHQAARHRRLVHAPHLPRVAHAHVQPQGPGARRLDGGAVLPARGRVARPAAAAAHRVRAGRGIAAPTARIVDLTRGRRGGDFCAADRAGRAHWAGRGRAGR